MKEISFEELSKISPKTYELIDIRDEELTLYGKARNGLARGCLVGQMVKVDC